MLGKLLKYELKATGRLLGLIYLAVLAVAAITGIVSGITIHREAMINNMTGEVTATTNSLGMAILILIYAILVIAMFVVSVVMILERFYNNLLKGEGYLMHTLPVPTWMHVASKTISAALWYVLAAVVLGLSLVIALLCTGYLPSIFREFGWAQIVAAFDGKKLWIVLFVICAFLQIIRVTLMFYLSMAIGGCATKHKLFYSGVAFIVILIILGVIGLASNMSLIFGTMALDDGSGFPLGNLFVRQIITDLIYSGIFFWLTQFLLKRKLNLE